MRVAREDEKGSLALASTATTAAHSTAAHTRIPISQSPCADTARGAKVTDEPATKAHVREHSHEQAPSPRVDPHHEHPEWGEPGENARQQKFERKRGGETAGLQVRDEVPCSPTAPTLRPVESTP